MIVQTDSSKSSSIETSFPTPTSHQAQSSLTPTPIINSDVLLLVFHHLPHLDLCRRCSLVSKQWKALSERNELWQALAVRVKLRLLPLETCSPENQTLMYYDRPIGQSFPIFRKMHTDSKAYVRGTFQAQPFCRLAGDLALPENVKVHANEIDKLIRNHFMGEVGLIPSRPLHLLLQSPIHKKAPQYFLILLSYLAQKNAFDLRGEARLMGALATTMPIGVQKPNYLQLGSLLEELEKLYHQKNVQGLLRALFDLMQSSPTHANKLITFTLQLCLTKRDTATANQIINSLSPHLSFEEIIQTALMTSINTVENFKLLFLNYPHQCTTVLGSTLSAGTFNGGLSRLRNCFVMANEDAVFFEILKSLTISPQVKECLDSLQLIARVKGNKSLEESVTAHLSKIQKDEASAEQRRKQEEDVKRRIEKMDLNTF